MGWGQERPHAGETELKLSWAESFTTRITIINSIFIPFSHATMDLFIIHYYSENSTGSFNH